MTTRTTGSFDTGGERIYYESIGDGDPVVLSHGLGGNHACWWQVVPALSAHHRVITWDQRGFGNSTRRTADYGPEPAINDLLGLLDHLRLERVQLLGQSMGGWVAMGFALRHRERVRSLVLTDTLAGVFTAEINSEVRKAIGTALSRFRGDTLGEHLALGESFCRRCPDLAFLYQEISSMGDKPDDAEVFSMLGAMQVPLDEVAVLDLPILLVVGDADALCPPSAMRLVADQIPGADLQVIADAGHSPYFERPEEWTELVGAFLRRHASQ
ncbi:MAG TPA: alpha/beta hydrolase [Acidimicrobiales bacterium]|nr:alpha/beta hydrolase [Acidimicrobiales bacterium]